MSEQTIKVEFDPTTPMPDKYIGSDQDGPQYVPQTLLDVVAERAATQIVGAEKDLRERVSELVEARVHEELDRMLPGLLASAIEDGREITDRWGNVQQTKSIRELIVEYAEAQLKITGGNRGLPKDTVLAKVVKDEIGYSLDNQLREAVQDAKSELAKRLREQTADDLAKSIVTALTKRQP